MLNNLPFALTVAIFLAAAIITWLAGVTLAKATDSLDTRFKIGDALGGLILLGIAGSLPEVAVVASAAKTGHFAVVTGNLIGGLAIQTLIIAIFDFAVRKKRPLSYLAGSLLLSLETAFAIVLTALAIVGMYIPERVNMIHLSPASVLILIVWILGLMLVNRERKSQRFNRTAADAKPGRKHHERRVVENHAFYAARSNLYVIGAFALAAVLTLIAGVLLEQTGTAIADHFNIADGIFAATAIALATSLPEISTGLESIFIGDNQLAICDIIGGNAFMLVLFPIADLVARRPVLSLSSHSDLIFGILGILMMAIYAVSFVKHLHHRYFRLGVDSILEILFYVGGVYLTTRIH